MKKTKFTPADYIGKPRKSPAAIQKDAEKRLKGKKRA